MIVVFDGVCNFCNGWVAFVIRHDRAGRLRFAAAQTLPGRGLLQAHGVSPDALDTVLLVDGDHHYARSEAVLRILEALGGPWRLAGVLRLLPAPRRDAAYDAFARRRYRLFGRSATCRVPAPALRDRFLA